MVLVNPQGYEQHFEFAEKVIYTENDLTFFRGVAKALLDSGKVSDIAGFDAFKESLADAATCEDCEGVAELYGNAKKAMIVFTQNFVTAEAASMLANLALLSGHIGSPRDGIVQVKAKNNSQGLIDLGIRAGAEAMDGVKALLIFGEEPKADLSGVEFLMVSDTHMTEVAAKADVVLPATGFANTEEVDFNNWEIAVEIAHVYEVDFGWEDECDISEEMEDMLPKYKYAEVGEVLGGAMAPTEDAAFAVVGDAKFVDPLPCTDSLMNVIAERIPKMAE